MPSTLAPLVDTLESLAAKQPVLREKLPTSKEMEVAWRDLGNHLVTFRTLNASESLPSAIELNLLRYSVASLEHHLKLLAGGSADPEIRAARNLTEKIRALSADAPVRSIVPRMRRSKVEGETTCPGCGRSVQARIEEGQIVFDWSAPPG